MRQAKTDCRRGEDRDHTRRELPGQASATAIHRQLLRVLVGVRPSPRDFSNLVSINAFNDKQITYAGKQGHKQRPVSEESGLTLTNRPSYKPLWSLRFHPPRLNS